MTPNAVTGTPFNFTVKAQDAFGNSTASYTGTVHFTSSDPLVSAGSGLPADYTFLAADNGVHVFSATLATPGNQTITATDKVTSSITGTTPAIPVRGLRSQQRFAHRHRLQGLVQQDHQPGVAQPLQLCHAGGNVTLQGLSGPAVRGTIMFDSSNLVLYVRQNRYGGDGAPVPIGLLVPGSYTLTIQSGSSGLTDAGGGLSSTEPTTAPRPALCSTSPWQPAGPPNASTVVIPTNAISVAIPDYARGPDSNVGDTNTVPNNVGFGVPISITNATGATQVTFNLNYNTNLVNITGAVNALGNQTGNSFTLTVQHRRGGQFPMDSRARARL